MRLVPCALAALFALRSSSPAHQLSSLDRLHCVYPALICQLGSVIFRTHVASVCTGINIAGTGFQYWGGGVFCAENVNGLAPQQIACQVPVPPANTTFVTGECYAPAVSMLVILCSLPLFISCRAPLSCVGSCVVFACLSFASPRH